MLFYRYISENLTEYFNAMERAAGRPDFDYAALSDEEAETVREATVQEKGYFILPSQLFVNVRQRAATDANVTFSAFEMPSMDGNIRARRISER